ncbi:MAG: hypothetical protein L3J69_06260, partial [Desulfobacula sp.]|nr:hypothetical protein [Desulfobacula sp.]
CGRLLSTSWKAGRKILPAFLLLFNVSVFNLEIFNGLKLRNLHRPVDARQVKGSFHGCLKQAKLVMIFLSKPLWFLKTNLMWYDTFYMK